MGSCAGRQPAWPLVLSVERASVDTYVCVGHGGGSGPIVRLVFPKLAAPTPHPCGASGGAASLIAVAPPSLSVDRTRAHRDVSNGGLAAFSSAPTAAADAVEMDDDGRLHMMLSGESGESTRAFVSSASGGARAWLATARKLAIATRVAESRVSAISGGLISIGLT